ncbi:MULTISPECIES: helix-turn-helix transcriptional regulator [Halorussus]|uniref:helix-turn-helix transcriptional regulator n=1 Tax=Halorussus TaxID=1070314 RepID=UPI0020A09474|nr:GntR family transcriptional regulator [Halorussus vallis]USZ77747.1 GntR family transcriptional regulator [Halorussus vallis]
MAGQQQSPTELFGLVNQRYAFLAALDEAVYAKRDLVDELDVSRSTVDRALRELETAQLVTTQAGRYEITLYGRTLLACFESVIDTTEHVQRAKPLLALLPPDVDFEFSLLLDAEVQVVAEPGLHTPATRIAELVEGASRIRGLAYAHTSLVGIDLFEKKILVEGTETEFVLHERVYESLVERRPDLVADATACDCFSGYVVPDLPYGLLLLSTGGRDTLCLVVYGPNRQLKGAIINDAPRAVAWGRNVFERYRAEGIPLDAG